MSNDPAHKATDDLIEELEKKIKREYEQAEKEAEAKLARHLARYKANDAKKQALVKSGEWTQKQYNNWRTGQIMMGQRWEELCATLSEDMLNADKIAQSMTKGFTYDAYALNHNYATFEVEKGSLVDTSYTLYDKQTVEKLIRDDPQILPPLNPEGKTAQAIREGKVLRWNQQKVTSALTQGILQGESIDNLAKRMRGVADMDYRASIRNARTAMTGAQNAGRQAGYERAQEMGIDTEKQWLAVMDNRTRHEHAVLDGQHVPVDEDFKVGVYEIEYPGDPSAEPEMVYNCRCTMICRIKGFEKDFTDRQNPALGDMTYEEWKAEHEKKIKKPEEMKEEAPAELKLDKLSKAMNPKDFEAFYNDVDTADNRKLYEMYGDTGEYRLKKTGGRYYLGSNIVEFSYSDKEGIDRYSTLAHEFNHLVDKNAGRAENCTFTEIDHINEKTKGRISLDTLGVCPSVSDEFLTALRADMEELKPLLQESARESYTYAGNSASYYRGKSRLSEMLFTSVKDFNASAGIQDALDGFYGGMGKTFGWGHGDRYYNRMYNGKISAAGKEKAMQEALKDLGFDASSQAKVKRISRQYEAASEAWANVGSAITTQGRELELFEQYMPKTVKAYKKIVEGL